MLSRCILLAALLGMTSVALADTPNVTPGLWAFTNEVRIEGDMDIPTQSHDEEQCVTEEDLDTDLMFLDVEEACEIEERNVRSDSMSYSLSCEEQGVRMSMRGEMEFRGETVSGTTSGQMETPMGNFTMHTKLSGQRIGACE